MNKYQEALKSFEEAYRNVTSDDELTNTKRDLLQDLIDRETPKKTIPQLPNVYVCPCCDCISHTKQEKLRWHKVFSRYCRYCGQHLDLSE